MPESVRANKRTSAPVRRRPKDRKEQIARVAAEAFSTYGYNRVGIDDIAAEVGISGPALYRHFPNKYTLFRHVALNLADALVTASVGENLDSHTQDPEAALENLFTRVIDTTIENRNTGGLYRWEHRYLDAADRREVRARIVAVDANVDAALARVRPALTDKERAYLATGALSVIGSITAHRTPLSDKRITAIILESARSVAHADLTSLPVIASAPPQTGGLAPHSKRELLLRAAVELFYQRGYHDVSIEEIGAAADLNASGVYRYFESKSDLLAAVFTRASERLSAATSAVLADAASPLAALHRLIEVYVQLSFAQKELMSVYFTEVGNLPDEQRRSLRHIQRLNVEEWVALLQQLLPSRPLAELRFLVHAALALPLDLGRRLKFEQSSEAQGTVARLMQVAMLAG